MEKDRANALRKILAEEYGIMSDHELLQAIKKTEPINIGIFVSPIIMENKEKKYEKQKVAYRSSDIS